MNLSNEFSKATNLGAIAKKWFAALEHRFRTAGIELTVKTGVDGSASLIAPAAFIAQAIKLADLPADKVLRVLVLTDDPVAVMDEGAWLGFAAELSGVLAVETYCTCEKVLHSSLFTAIYQLGVNGYKSISVEGARSQTWDLAVWIHPAIEAGESDVLVDLLPELHASGVPVYACMYNELDALIQSHGLAHKGLEFSWLDSPLESGRFSKATVSKFGIATGEIGVEGGWGAVLTKLTLASAMPNPGDWEYIRVAMSLFRLEGSTSATWSLGEVVAGIAFNKCQPVGLIGNLAVDPKTGLLLAECDTTKVLNAVGHVWTSELAALPKSNFYLLPWAARMKLAFNNSLTLEDKKRVESIELLRQAFDAGMVEAGIALARGYECTEASQDSAKAIYDEIGTRHPMSAYFLAHEAMREGREGDFVSALTVAANAGYVPAITDLGLVMKDCGNTEEALRLLTRASERGDAEAAFRLGEFLIKHGKYSEALDTLRTAWSKGHADSLNTAHWLCSEMIAHDLGKPGLLNRELKDIKFAIAKRLRYASQLERDVA